MPFDINVMDDVADLCKSRLSTAGYDIPNDSIEILEAYLQAKHRRISVQPRRLHFASFTVPDHLLEGYESLIEKIKNGGDIWPHQSRKILKSKIEDGMLNDFGIQHFHLGIGYLQNQPQLISGTSELLFAYVNDTDFYAIGIFDHSAWSNQSLLDIVHSNWPKITEPYTFKNPSPNSSLQLSQTYTNDDLAKLRNANINVITRRSDGSVAMGLGGGITTAGTSVKVSRELSALQDYIQKYQTCILSDFEKEIKTGGLCGNETIKVVWRNDRAFAVTVPQKLEMDLLGNLSFPEL